MPDPRLVAIGCYTVASGGRGTGVTICAADPDDGELTELDHLALPSPSWLEWHPTQPVLYAASETADGQVVALRVGADGTLERPGNGSTGGAVSTGGAAPCHLHVTADLAHLLVANYGGGVAVLALDPAGALGARLDLVGHEGHGPDRQRQEASHPHLVTARGDVVTVVDLGTDELRSYRLAATGRLAPLSSTALPPGTGPRQLVRSAAGCYAVGELGVTLLVLDEPEPGRFAVREVLSCSAGAPPVYPAQLTIDGGLAYVSNRGPDTLAIFDLSAPRPRLLAEQPLGARNPRHFALDGPFLYAAAQDDDVVVLFDRDRSTGALRERRRFPFGSPTCVAVRPR